MPNRSFTPEDLWGLRRVGQPQPLADGSAAVVPVTTYDIAANEGTTRLHLVDSRGTSRPLTHTGSATHPRVMAGRMAFLRKPDKGAKPQVQVLPLDGGEARQLTTLPLGVSSVEWLPSGKGLVIAAPLLRGAPSVDDTTKELERRGESVSRPIATEDRLYRYWTRWLADGETHHLFSLDLTTGDITHLTPGWDGLLGWDTPEGTFDTDPDGTSIVFSGLAEIAAQDRYQFALYRVPLAGGTPERLTDDPEAHELRPRYHPEGKGILYGYQPEWDFYADRIRLAWLDVASGARRVLTEDWDRSATGWEFIGPDAVVLGAADMAKQRLFRYRLGDPSPEAIETGDGSVHGARPAGGVLWFRSESAQAPPAVSLLDDGGLHRPDHFNEGLIEGLGAYEPTEFVGAAGATVPGWIVYPPGFDPDRRWPMLHIIHGGPHGLASDTWHWRWNPQVFAAAGYVVVTVNFHGSVSWGDDYTRSIRGAWADKPAADILAATDQMIDRGFIDPDRIAISGGSYGGYLVAWLTAHTDRYRCAVCHAGVTDLVGQWATDVTHGRAAAIAATPWEDFEGVMRWNPLAHTAGMRTPTLVTHGEKDYRVVVTQGLALYGILKEKGVEARLAYYPDEGHYIEKPQNSLHWHHEFLGWLDRHLRPDAANR